MNQVDRLLHAKSAKRLDSLYSALLVIILQLCGITIVLVVILLRLLAM